MGVNKGIIKKVIFEAIDIINQEIPIDDRISKNDTTRLSSKNGGLDSLNLINFVIYVEEMLEEKHGIVAPLTETENIFEPDGPLKDVQTFVAYLQEAGIE